MNTRTGELFTPEEVEKKFEDLTPEQQAEFKRQLARLTPDEYDKYAKLPEGERPIALAFDEYLGKKPRYNSPRTQRQAFYAGYHAAQANQVSPETAKELKKITDKLNELEDAAAGTVEGAT